MIIISQCVKKAKYNSQRLADKVAAKRAAISGKRLRTYYCGICGRWHITSAKSYREQLDERNVS
jgi:hypothetical protein